MIEIMEEEWDTLVVLDACRYDYFQKIYSDYLEGELQKLISPGTHTMEWTERVFDENRFYDVVYVSGNPYINSKGISRPDYNFNSKKCFYKVIDVWDEEWNKKLGTVPPEKVSKATRMARAKYPEKRIIVHFMQPHQPFITLGVRGNGISQMYFRIRQGKKSIKKRIRDFLGKLAVKFFGRKEVREMRRTLGLLSEEDVRAGKGGGPNEYRKVAEEFGLEGLRKAYENNLKIALRSVSNLVDRLPDEMIIVTSDHGEFLGENDIYGHPEYLNDSKIQLLQNVPWFKVSET